ncbi:bromodomain-containing protein 4-like isoform X3 [Anthonomus grandis grandis]|uniref:bromodomain-containing protein 4-like isoform X3 n=1 Tax=Anthonomus grandis grandis TaxID=2921223 RepID=UPI0021662B94|nr:bromodomain-containing protein 4-like isoform X3 [Anthonomus grandis grandis]
MQQTREHASFKVNTKKALDSNQRKTDRISQMSQQEIMIEQKKREIQAKLEAKRRQINQEQKEKKPTLPPAPPKDAPKSGINLFSNDGSFLNQFKQLNDKKQDSKFKTFQKYKDKERERKKEEEKDKEPESDIKEEEENNTEKGSEPSEKEDNSQPTPPSETLIKPPFNPDQFLPFEHPITGSFDTSFTSNPPPSFHHFDHNMPPPNMDGRRPSLLGPPPQISPLMTEFHPPPLMNFPPQSAENMAFNAHPQLSGMDASIPPPTHIITSTVTQEISHSSSLPPLIQQSLSMVPPPSVSDITTSTEPDTLSVSGPTLQSVQAPTHIFTTSASDQLLTAPPPNQVLLNVPPPQILPQTQIVLTPQDQNVLVSAPTSIITTVTIPPPVLTQQNINHAAPNLINMRPQGLPAPTVELTSIPPPNPIQPISSSPLTQNATPPQPSRIPSLMSQRVLPPPGMGINVPPPSIMHPPPPIRDVSQPPPNMIPPGPPPMINVSVPPPMIPPPAVVPPPMDDFNDELRGGSLANAEFEAMSNLARMVAECGPSVEDVVRQKKNRDPDLWFLFHKDSAAYRQYASLVEQYRKEREAMESMDEKMEIKPDPSEIYEPEMALEDDEVELDNKVEIKQELKQEDDSTRESRRERKRKSRWGEKDLDVKGPVILPVLVPPVNTALPPVPGSSSLLSRLTRNDPGLLQYAVQSYGSTNLSDEDWKKAEENYKVHLLYQDMLKKREEVERLQAQGKNKYEYDSDEETDGGTWEHKLREKEMLATERWASALTEQAEGKHHIGDFLPPEELKRFMEKSNALKEGRQPSISDYKEFKIKEDNVGFKMLQKLGWSEGQGLGQNNAGIVEPVNKGAPRENTQGLGLNLGEATEGEDEYDSYRKRMMLAYRFRPNPLNNPRRPYY